MKANPTCLAAFLSLALLFLQGCASLQPFEGLSMEELEKESLSRIAYRYSNSKYRISEEQLQEVEALMISKGFPKGDLEFARKSKVVVGMSQIGVIAALGYPYTRNETSSRYSSSEQWIFGLSPKRVYVQFDGNHVSHIHKPL